MIDENFLSAALILAKEELDVGDFVNLTGGAVGVALGWLPLPIPELYCFRNANEKVQPAMFRVPWAFFDFFEHNDRCVVVWGKSVAVGGSACSS